ncbi:hydantoinase B/oxoprolinase family protein [Caldisphaera sp.]|jgi:N-methylhydantoinase B|uniref:hydantoinase B/oxoprolinase family protein n=1 Tax=Caldisphaera sp. TaxID=2060322 RepID=UPI003D1330A3
MVSWEIIHRATSFISEEMGVALRRSALSPNIRERADHSCAIIDANERIVAQAEHIPVHLGSLRVGIKNLLDYLEKERIELNEGDMIFSNDPYLTGTHLNDVTVISGIYYKGKLIGYTANKAHHVDIGGPVFGSINPQATTIYEEGEIVPPVKLVEKGEIRDDILKMFLANVKSPLTNEGDLKAQIAANLTGIKRVKELIDKYGLDQTIDGWENSIKYGRELALKEISTWPKGEFTAEDYLETGTDLSGLVNINVNVKITENNVTILYPKLIKQLRKPLNAVFGVTFAASSFAIRSLMKGDIPTNEGLYSIINVIADEGSLLNATPPAPVSGGNLETSQRIVDVILLALSKAMPDRIPAASSGTMMNVMLGGYDKNGKPWAYYETIGGGSGARPNGDGVSGVHTNMTNTMNTPIEITESTYPMFFTSYKIREGSGGEGKYRGGDGIVRSFKVLYPARLAVMSSRFLTNPYGLFNGKPGKPSKLTIKRKNGSIEDIKPLSVIELFADDEVIIETPGGGGYG